ncbi:MAG: hypothetical protein QOE45_3005 [Frankiaceae bacterium]|jgi:hypothetical protein|nr:hypothetical protein [Frankiaceae bacterium]
MSEAADAPAVTTVLGRAAARVPLHEVTRASEVSAVSDVVIYERLDAGGVARGDLVLGVGLSSHDAVRRAVKSIAASLPSALVVREECVDDATVAAATAADLTLWSVPPQTSWARLLTCLQEALRNAIAPERAVDAFIEPATADLFTFADLLAECVGGSVTIEDTESRLLAYSTRQDEMDPVRQATILGRHVPSDIVETDRREGLFRRLQSERQPIYLDVTEPGGLPRLVVMLEWAGLPLGYAWAAVRERPSADRQQAFQQAAKRVALQLFRRQAESDHVSRERRALALALLGGTAGADDAAERLGLPGDGFQVLRVGVRDRATEDSTVNVSLFRAVESQLGIFHLPAVAVELDTDCYVILDVGRDVDLGRQRALRNANELVNRMPSAAQRQLLVSISGHAPSVADLPQARREADQVIRVLRSDDRLPRVADLASIRLPAWNLAAIEAAAAATNGSLPGPLDPVVAHDARRGTRFLPSLRAYLEALGNIPAAAASEGVHPNTMRYRLRRIAEIGDLDLEDPAHWLAALMHLRTMDSGAPDLGREP